MKGLRIAFRDKRFEIVADLGISVFVYQRNTHFYVSVSGLEIKSKDNMITHRWIDSEMQPEESIEVEIIDIQKNSEQGKQEIAFTDSTALTENEIEEMFEEKLTNFYVLEKLLKEEGLID